MKRRGFFKVVLSGTGAAVLPGQRSREVRGVCRWAEDHCANFDPDQFFLTECGQDFLVAKGRTREENGFLYCAYCGGMIIELKTGELCGQVILGDLRREGVIG